MGSSMTGPEPTFPHRLFNPTFYSEGLGNSLLPNSLSVALLL
jgi:hypothetical protein